MSQAIAVIPARGGSKRIPRKNVRDFCGKPMIAWPIEELRAARLFDHIVVSTDDAEIAATAKKCGAEVPFSRPRELADDQASTDSVLLHALTECQRIYGAIERGCCVYPTTPFLAVADLRAGLDLLLANRATSAFPVVRYDFPIEQAFVLEGARPVARWPEKLAARSQDLRDHFHDAGVFYWFDAGKFTKSRVLFGDDSVAFPIDPSRCQDINTEADWAQAELKFNLLRQAGKL